uniref:Uncharacterized protein n=1 Tax=Ananas comosus var. bracteatus TaxID=296719 RepID=A0A6V7QL57_ANACO|nr:unnamed protein product [Ananas comosus var. bracteatus]
MSSHNYYYVALSKATSKAHDSTEEQNVMCSFANHTLHRANSDPSFGCPIVGPKIYLVNIVCADMWLVVGEVRRIRIWAQHTAGGGTEGEQLCSLEVSNAQKEVWAPESGRSCRVNRPILGESWMFDQRKLLHLSLLVLEDVHQLNGGFGIDRSLRSWVWTRG